MHLNKMPLYYHPQDNKKYIAASQDDNLLYKKGLDDNLYYRKRLSTKSLLNTLTF